MVVNDGLDLWARPPPLAARRRRAATLWRPAGGTGALRLGANVPVGAQE